MFNANFLTYALGLPVIVLVFEISAVGKSGVHTRIVGLDRETNKELLVKHIQDCGSEGAPFKELQQVLPGHSRGQIQTLLRGLRKDNRIHNVGTTSAGRWYIGPMPEEDN